MRGMPGGMSQLLKQANQVQMKMKKTQEELAQRIFEGKAGGDGVVVTVSGEYLLKTVKINPEVVKSADVEMLQDLVLAAANDAIKNAKEVTSKEMEKVTGGMNIPGMF
jgi:DNA-binding YbaB/EbfC family protein